MLLQKRRAEMASSNETTTTKETPADVAADGTVEAEPSAAKMDSTTNKAAPVSDDATAPTRTSTLPSTKTLPLTQQALVMGRQDLWKTHLPGVLEPLREFLIDPSLKLGLLVLSPMAKWLGKYGDRTIAFLLRIFSLAPLSLFLLLVGKKSTPNEDDVRGTAKRQLLQMPLVKPPSDFISALRGSLAFLFSATNDVVGAFLNPKKLKKWYSALAQFRAYLETSGVGAELEESIMKPLYRGRLIDNLKILNDIQEMMEEEAKESMTEQEQKQQQQQQDDLLESELLPKATKLMRFATAAYGAEIIKSAIDKQVSVLELESSERKAISLHTDIPEEDIKYLRITEGGDMMSLRHYIALDHSNQCIVLALRGTLSISGALIDMQAMDCEFGGVGRAHLGMADMADGVWKESGECLQELWSQHKDYELVITGHSLGAGTACLLHVKIYSEQLLPVDDKNRKVLCYGFAPPPTFSLTTTNDKEADAKDDATRLRVKEAIQNCTCFIHDNDVVPHLSVASIRRLATVLDTIDNYTENVWFWNRSRIFWEWSEIPEELVTQVKKVLAMDHGDKDANEDDNDACELLIPARLVVWMKHKKTKSTKSNNEDAAGASFDAIACDCKAVAIQPIFICEDMVTDHMPEQYEDALDDLMVTRSM